MNQKSKTDLSDQQLKFALTLTKHKVFLWRAFLFILFFGNVLIFVNLGYQWVKYVSVVRAGAEELGRGYIDTVSFHRRHAPEAIVIGDRGTVSAGKNILDGYVLLRNPNSNWLAVSATVKFSFAGGSFTESLQRLHPGSDQYVFFFRQPREKGVGFIVTVEGVRWKRVKTPLPSRSDYFAIRDPEIRAVGGESKSARFRLHNLSLTSFWQVPINIVLFDYQDAPVGLNAIVVNELIGQKEREVEAIWHERLPPIARMLAQIPEVVFLEENRMTL